LDDVTSLLCVAPFARNHSSSQRDASTNKIVARAKTKWKICTVYGPFLSVSRGYSYPRQELAIQWLEAYSVGGFMAAPSTQIYKRAAKPK